MKRHRGRSLIHAAAVVDRHVALLAMTRIYGERSAMSNRQAGR
ncbi:hypothetical protein [Phytohalomonas tamaricis]|nr:hypothetical protein [Phytohalomonas tamaricis]